jgi:serine/threonine protein phosphatase 1
VKKEVHYRPVRRLPTNRSGRDCVLGDLHGHTTALRYLLRQAAFDVRHDRLLSVGDLVDRGDYSEEAIGLLERPWFHAVRGNHEDMLISVVDGRLDFEHWAKVGGEWARSVPREVLASHAARLRELPLALMVGTPGEGFNLVHAEFFGSDTALGAGYFSEHVRERLLWGRQLIGGTAGASPETLHRGLSPTYCGHTPVERVQTVGAQIFVDTGVFTRMGRLTMVEPATGASHTVSAAEAARAGADSWPWPGDAAPAPHA